MPISSALAAVAVADLEQAGEFYRRVFDRPADVEPMPTLKQWNLEPAGGVQVVEDVEHSGSSMCTLLVTDLDGTVADLGARGVQVGEVAEPDESALTTAVVSASLPVADQDAAIRFYVDVLGFEVRADLEGLPGARLVEVAPPGSDVGLVLLPPGSDIPMAVRLGTVDADAALARLRETGAHLHNDEVLHLDGSPPMFFFADPDGNGLVYLQVSAS